MSVVNCSVGNGVIIAPPVGPLGEEPCEGLTDAEAALVVNVIVSSQRGRKSSVSRKSYVTPVVVEV